jgi:dipeptidyl aminopeptidase/acylaminoacyl peptidase
MKFVIRSSWRAARALPSGILILAVTATGSDQIPIESFFRDPQIRSVKISPDGEYIAYLRPHKGKFTLFTMALGDPGSLRGVTGRWKTDISRFFWADAEEIVFSASYERYYALGLFTIHRETRRQKELSSKPHWIFDTLRLDPRNFLVTFYSKKTFYPDISRVGVSSLHPVIAFRNPGSAIGFIDDYSETIRILHCYENGEHYDLYRESNGHPWKRVEFPPETVPLEFSRSDDFLYVASSLNADTMGLYLFDLASWKLGELILSHPRYDIQSHYLGNDTTTFQSLRSGHKYGGLVSVSYETTIPKTVWLQPDLANLQRLIDKTLPDTINFITSVDDGFRRFVIHSFSDREPGVFYLFNAVDSELTIIARVNETIDPGQMARMSPFQLSTRDGPQIEGYLTRPLQAKTGEAGPMIVLVHGGPWVRDSFRFDPETQFLANRGYTVLQINYRGSSGYGKKHMRNSVREMGGMMQNDITDAVRWTIDKGFADPNRIGIMGWSFGGYSTVYGLIHHPDLYTCGVALSGVYDWSAHMLERKKEFGRDKYDYFRSIFGDPQEEAAFYRSVSLLNKIHSRPIGSAENRVKKCGRRRIPTKESAV